LDVAQQAGLACTPAEIRKKRSQLAEDFEQPLGEVGGKQRVFAERALCD
jgi:hypothetical protein